MASAAAPDQMPATPGGRRPLAMTPYAIAVALFAAFVVGGILAKAVPLWLVAMTSLAIGAAVFVFVDRYPRLPREPVIPRPGDPRRRRLGLARPRTSTRFPRHRTQLPGRKGSGPSKE
jgi:hypothetical protein